MAGDRKHMPGSDKTEAAKLLAMLRPYLDNKATLANVATDAGVPLRTVQRWVARYQEDGPAGLARQARSNVGARKLFGELVGLIEDVTPTKPPLSIATIHRRISTIACDWEWNAPFHANIHAIVSALNRDPRSSGCASFGRCTHVSLIFLP